jgi:hypothetical protein
MQIKIIRPFLWLYLLYTVNIFVKGYGTFSLGCHAAMTHECLKAKVSRVCGNIQMVGRHELSSLAPAKLPKDHRSIRLSARSGPDAFGTSPVVGSAAGIFLTYGLRIYALAVDIRYQLSLLEGSPKVKMSVSWPLPIRNFRTANPAAKTPSVLDISPPLPSVDLSFHSHLPRLKFLSRRMLFHQRQLITDIDRRTVGPETVGQTIPNAGPTTSDVPIHPMIRGPTE